MHQEVVPSLAALTAYHICGAGPADLIAGSACLPGNMPCSIAFPLPVQPCLGRSMFWGSNPLLLLCCQDVHWLPSSAATLASRHA